MEQSPLPLLCCLLADHPPTEHALRGAPFCLCVACYASPVSPTTKGTLRTKGNNIDENSVLIVNHSADRTIRNILSSFMASEKVSCCALGTAARPPVCQDALQQDSAIVVLAGRPSSCVPSCSSCYFAWCCWESIWAALPRGGGRRKRKQPRLQFTGVASSRTANGNKNTEAHFHLNDVRLGASNTNKHTCIPSLFILWKRKHHI